MAQRLVLGIESSCDETAAAVVDADGQILAQTIYSQTARHQQYGGVVPELAARLHLDHIETVVNATMTKAAVAYGDLTAIAATVGPGLIGGVIVGAATAKAIALAHGIRFFGVNHLEGHALSCRLCERVDFPYLLLLVSGGHSQILAVLGFGSYRLYGTSLDDALGEAFDKVAKILELSQDAVVAEVAAGAGDAGRVSVASVAGVASVSGGASVASIAGGALVERAASRYSERHSRTNSTESVHKSIESVYTSTEFVDTSTIVNYSHDEAIASVDYKSLKAEKIWLPRPMPRPMKGRPMVAGRGADFSFSGLKTAVRLWVEREKKASTDGTLSDFTKQQIAYEFQNAATDCLIDRLKLALAQFRFDYGNLLVDLEISLVIAGGVAANRHIRQRLEAFAKTEMARLIAPPMALCTDNAAMIAWVGQERLALNGDTAGDSLAMATRPRWPLDSDGNRL